MNCATHVARVSCLLGVVVLAACGDTSLPSNNVGGGGNPGVGGGPGGGGSSGSDLGAAGSDLGAAGSGGADLGAGGGGVGHGETYKYVINSLQLPMGPKEFAWNLDGTTTRNQMGNIISTLGTQNLDTQATVTASVVSGSVETLFGLTTIDPTETNDSSVEVDDWSGTGPRGAAMAVDGGTSTCSGSCPDFSGKGTFTIDPASKRAFLGALTGGRYQSTDPATASATEVVQLTVNLALLPGGPPVPLPLNGAHLMFTTGTDPTYQVPALLQGQLQGSIKNSDVQGRMIPAIAVLLTRNIQVNPDSVTSQQLSGLFDIGGCTNPDGTEAQAGDGVISACEVAQNPIIEALLAPDVKIYDDNGRYNPGAGSKPDSLSFGMGFTAVKARF